MLVFLLLVAPNLAIILTFSYWPIVQSIYLSLTSWDLTAPTPIFVGLANYRDLLTSSQFGTVMINSLIYAAAIVLATVLCGLLLALLLSQRLRGSSFGRTISFAPYVITGSAIATLWLFIFAPNYGLLRALTAPFGINLPDWVHNPSTALWSLIIVQVWRNVGFAAIVYVAGLQSLPQDLYEAAALDGAGAWTKLRRITLPLLSPLTFFLLIITTLHSFRAYEVTAILTGGGPGLASTTLTWYIYQLAFTSFDIGHATAASVILFALLLAVTALQAKFAERRVHYQ